jgi:pyruvate/2-oxoglutarate dehydrogenase complex dihydrolipoamide acyltransferase (E2) component
MVLEIRVPEAGFSITEGKVLEWKKREGDSVEAGETILSIETEKITVDIPAETSGVLQEIRVKAGETAPVGGIVGVIRTEGSGAVLEADGAVSGAAEGSGKAAGKAVARTRSETGETDSSVGRKRKISPLAKALARAHGMNLDGLAEGSGPEGRIVKEDVLRRIKTLSGMGALDRAAIADVKTTKPYAAAAPAAPLGVKPSSGADSAAPTPAAGYSRRVPYAGWRKVIAERMTASVRNAPQYTMSADVDVTELSELIESTRGRADKPKLTYLPFVMKACVAGIDLVPEVNAFCFDDGYSFEQQVNIGIAVDLGEKLLVPVVKDVRAKSILRLAEEVQNFADRARSEKLEPRDIEGGTFTITNVGVYGVHSGTPMLLQP